MKRIINTTIAAFLVTAFASVSMASGSMDCGNMHGGRLFSGKKLNYQTQSSNNGETSSTVKAGTR